MDKLFISLLPPLVAILFSLKTKEVNISLIAGIFVGALLYTGFHPIGAVSLIFSIMSERIGANVTVLAFLILLGMLVTALNQSGATEEYARWAGRKLTTRRQTLLATAVLGVIIFIDDYFNCLTVGTVMRPITDRNRISRQKLAYIIDSTAAPVVILAPISSWAAAVGSALPAGSKIDGFQLFMKTIPANYYAWFCLLVVFLTTVLSVDFGKMRKYEDAAMERDIQMEMEITRDGNAEVYDLILPVLVLIVSSVLSMLYTGGILEGKTIAAAFADCDSALSLCIGGIVTMVFTAALYLPRKIVTPKTYMEGLTDGFKNMVPTILILTFAWTLSGICSSEYLNTGGAVSYVITRLNIPMMVLPAIFFVIAMLLALSTGTSWGTFAILLPISVSIFQDQLTPYLVFTAAAVLSGSVCGDHLSPISDTTIMSSTGAECNHLQHVETQAQYGAIAAIGALVSYLAAGITSNAWIGTVAGLVPIGIFFVYLYAHNREPDI
ncbi:MAG: Na+/H+ antiporter NhaC family protein [Erysipelotrichales bacterium]|nr:Na+/H+ antiporter NhaC family protein [Erysipelotrichales bacterium]MBQ1385447.1 Na+/H+ antiporter NhaC family protein [Erysipelotrichales bacterium]MBQ2477886.1 Na+/H+ antiporter NhaC family protein [Erysipelotrichales bacterium]MBQ5541723.1 Na+/H+ antiporter NhaC family protein [Erysipelotrichales bacterium]